MGTLRKLKRSSRESRKRFEYIPWDVSPAVRPMSEVLSEFAEPLLEEMGDEHLRVGVSVAALAWNMATMPPKEGEAALGRFCKDKVIGEVLTSREMRELLRFLVDRKKQMYGDDERLILSYTFVEEQGDLRLLVASTPLQWEI